MITGKQAKGVAHLSRAAAEIQVTAKSPLDQLRWRPMMAVRGITPTACSATEKQEVETWPVWWLKYLLLFKLPVFVDHPSVEEEYSAPLWWFWFLPYAYSPLPWSYNEFLAALLSAFLLCSVNTNGKQVTGTCHQLHVFPPSVSFTCIQPLSPFLPTTPSIATLPSFCWLLELTMLCVSSVYSSSCLFSPRTCVSFSSYCPSLFTWLCYQLLVFSTCPTSETYLPIHLLLLHLLPQLLKLLAGFC